MDFSNLFGGAPTGEPMDFESFASAISGVPIEDLDQYLEGTDEDYADEDPAEDESAEVNHDDTTAKPNVQDVRMTDEYFDFTDDEDEEEGISSDDEMMHDSDNQPPEMSDTDSCFNQHNDHDQAGILDNEEVLSRDDPEFQAVLASTERVLGQLSLAAQSVIDKIPLSTQIILSNQANEEVFKPYAKHGSAAQLSASVMKFLAGGDTVRRPGKNRFDKSKDGKLDFGVLAQEWAAEEDEANKGDHGPDDHDQDNRGRSFPTSDEYGPGADLKVLKRCRRGAGPDNLAQHTGQDESSNVLHNNADATNNDQIFRKPSNSSEHSNETRSFSGSSGTKTTATRSISGTSSMTTFNSNNSSRKSSLTDPSIHEGYTPLAAGFSNVGLYTPAQPYFGMPLLTSTLTPPSQAFVPNHTCSIDIDENARLYYEPFNPVSMEFIWPATLRSNGKQCMPTPGILDSLNQILFLSNLEAQHMLQYYTEKYGDLMPADSTGLVRQHPPHALFRLGIAQYVMSKVGKLIENKERDELGLTPEARSLLRGVWEAHPSMQAHFEDTTLDDIAELEWEVKRQKELNDDMDEDEEDEDDAFANISASDPGQREGGPLKPRVKGGLNKLEKTLLARACNISVETVDAFWDNMREQTKAWAAMKAWCHARSAERVAKAKREGSW